MHTNHAHRWPGGALRERHLRGGQQGYVRRHHPGLRVPDLGPPVDEQLSPGLGDGDDDAEHGRVGLGSAARHEGVVVHRCDRRAGRKPTRS